ncbi:MAG: hypothetical protein ACFFC7_25760 [Candidatus Hermodarchaeota archaeon]
MVLLLIVILMLHPPVFTLTQALTWFQTYGGRRYDSARALIQTTDGGYALAGTGTTSSYYGAEGSGFWLVKTDSNGITQWDQMYGEKGGGCAEALIQTTDGGYALAGGTSSYGTWSPDYWLVKTDSNGIMQWNQTYGGDGSDSAWALIQTTDGGYALAGGTNSYDTWRPDYWLVKTDSNGIMQWNQTYGGEEVDFAFALIQTTDGGYALAGWTTSYGAGKYDYWLVKTDSNGIMQWNQTYGGEEPDSAFALIQTTDGGYALAGETSSYGAGFFDCWLVKTDNNGIMQWNQTYGGWLGDSAQALIQTTDGGYALAGWTSSYGAGGSDFWLVKTDSNGITQWNQTYGGEKSDSAWALIQTTDGGYALAGETSSYGAGEYDCWLVKTDGINFLITVFRYLAIGLIGSSIGLLISRPVYRRYNKRRQKRAISKALMDNVN